MPHARWFLLILVAVLAGCASAGGGSDRPAHRSNLLTQEEILDSNQTNLFDVVQSLRPHWLRRRGQVSFTNPNAGEVIVYMDNVQAGGAEYLRQINVNGIDRLEFLNETEANARFGVRHGFGAAIIIHTLGGF